MTKRNRIRDSVFPLVATPAAVGLLVAAVIGAAALASAHPVDSAPVRSALGPFEDTAAESPLPDDSTLDRPDFDPPRERDASAQPNRWLEARARKPKFKWPENLTLTPGQEAAAAAMILRANGIGPQHPVYPEAARRIVGILVDFARTHPHGGDLPVGSLKRVIRQAHSGGRFTDAQQGDKRPSHRRRGAGSSKPPIRGGFAWPANLAITPGQEWQAAQRILELNGVSQRHPGFAAASSKMTALLQSYARSAPRGGQLPVAPLQKIIEEAHASYASQPDRPEPRRKRPKRHRPPTRTKKSGLVWPTDLTIVPGAEATAAARILQMNGIGPQHRNYKAAVDEVAAALTEFIRSSPAGGDLPTGRLGAIIKKAKSTGLASTEAPPGTNEPKSGRSWQKGRRGFVWPTDLALTPGNEWAAARDIVLKNGIGPDDPVFAGVSRQIEAVLKNFTQNLPQGGDLPTAPLAKILEEAKKPRRSPPPRAQTTQPPVPAPAPPPPAGAPAYLTNVVPGYEWQAARDFVTSQGIQVGHPRYIETVSRVERALKKFTAASPGGPIPTAPLAKIVQAAQRAKRWTPPSSRGFVGQRGPVSPGRSSAPAPEKVLPPLPPAIKVDPSVDQRILGPQITPPLKSQ